MLVTPAKVYDWWLDLGLFANTIFMEIRKYIRQQFWIPYTLWDHV